jgi:putative endonuclease
MYVVYILQCADGSLYTGITNDLPKRLAKHQAGTASHYTRAKGVRQILYTERKRTKGNALKREYQIKQLSRKQKLALIQHNTKDRS